MSDDELIEAMALAAESEMKKPRLHVSDTRCDNRMSLCIGLRAALAVVRPVIEREALERAISLPLMLEIQPPETGPFTREDRAIEQYRSAIRAIL